MKRARPNGAEMPNLERVGLFCFSLQNEEVFHVEYFVVTRVYVQRYEENRGKRVEWLGLG